MCNLTILNSLDSKPFSKGHILFLEQYKIQIEPIFSKFQEQFKTSNIPTNEDCSVFFKKMQKKVKQLKIAFPYTYSK